MNRYKKWYHNLKRAGVTQIHYKQNRSCDEDISIRSTYEYLIEQVAMTADHMKCVTKTFLNHL